MVLCFRVPARATYSSTHAENFVTLHRPLRGILVNVYKDASLLLRCLHQSWVEARAGVRARHVPQRYRQAPPMTIVSTGLQLRSSPRLCNVRVLPKQRALLPEQGPHSLSRSQAALELSCAAIVGRNIFAESAGWRLLCRPRLRHTFAEISRDRQHRQAQTAGYAQVASQHSFAAAVTTDAKTCRGYARDALTAARAHTRLSLFSPSPTCSITTGTTAMTAAAKPGGSGLVVSDPPAAVSISSTAAAR
jgi:hypothetical protein